MPLIESKYLPKFPFTNTHFNTTFRTFFTNQKVNYDRKRLELIDGDFMDLDFSKVGSETVVIVLHGLEGSSQSRYVLAVTNQLNSHKMDVTAINMRGCSGEQNRIYASYHSGKTEDLEIVIDYIYKTYDYKNIIVLGYSLGGNIVLKYLGEQSKKLNQKIACAIAISTPCDLAGSSKELSKSINTLYMLRFLKRLKSKTLLKMDTFPNENLNRKAITKAKDFADYDNLYTAPAHGFINAKDYWKRASSKPYLHKIKIPTLMISAQDDTFLSDECYPNSIAENHTHLYLETPEFGGHVGFNQKIIGSNGFWLENRIVEFIENYI